MSAVNPPIILISGLATIFSSILGVWHGVSLLFADFVHNMRGTHAAGDGTGLETSPVFRFYVLWLIFPPMILLTVGQPSALIIACVAFGAFFMPFLALTPILLLNGRAVPREWRSGGLSNLLLALA